MKTKFIKKLSFVLVVAMVLSLLVPATGAFAASAKLNSSKKYLHLGREESGENEFNFNIKNKQKGWKYAWESNDEDVVEVNAKNGVVTATGVGKTKVTVLITDEDGEEVDTLSATVTVRDNIETVAVKNPVEKLTVNEEHDYNRSFETESGSTKKTDSITRWEVVPAEGASIDDKGVFVATAAGEYTITARSFQSKARYNAWDDDAEKYADYVLATAETKVVVSASIASVKQVNKTKFNVEFDSSMADTDLSATTAMVYQVINGKLYNTGTEKIKSLSLDATGKVATVEIFGNIISKADYQFVYGDLKGEFKAADTNIKEVAGLTFDDFQVKSDGSDPVDLYGKVNAVNMDGVVILGGNDDELKPYLSFKYEGDVNYGWVYDGKAYINKDGYAGKFNVKYNNFVLNDETKIYEAVEFEAFAMGVGVDVIVSNNTMQYAIVKADTAPDSWKSDWKTGEFNLPADDQNFKIYTRYKKNTDPSWASYTNAAVDQFTYVSSNSDKLVIIGHYLYPISQGTVTVLVQDPANNNVVVGAFDVVIQAARGYASAVPNIFNTSLGNASLAAYNETREIAVTNTDTMNEGVVPTLEEIKLISKPATAADTAMLISLDRISTNSWEYGKAFFKVTAPGEVPGYYNYKITLKAFNTTKSFNIHVTVLDSSVATVTNWKVELDSTSVELKEQKGIKNVTANVYGYNAKGARVAVLPTSDYTLDVKKVGTSTNIKS
ncbi:MAG: hypothetical protein PHC56_08955, partial [Herbinix sp.]|nr:hypothetical protein [Herbinix sp.]